jgi:hypothetical protein
MKRIVLITAVAGLALGGCGTVTRTADTRADSVDRQRLHKFEANTPPVAYTGVSPCGTCGQGPYN